MRGTTIATHGLHQILEEILPPLNVDVLNGEPNGDNVEQTSTQNYTHVSAIQETICDEMLWHIARLPKTSGKACFALQAITKKNCTSQIVQNNIPTVAPTYTSMMVNYTKNRNEHMQFFFCNDDIECCMKGTRRKWVLSVLAVLTIWPVKMGTKLSVAEILALKVTGFLLSQRQVISPRRLFGGETSIGLWLTYPVPSSPNEHPHNRAGKVIRRNPKAPTAKQQNNYASALTMNARIGKVTMVPHPGFGCIVSLHSGVHPRSENYMLTISLFPECTCPNFKEMKLRSLGKRGAWTNCKHLYYVFTITCNLQSTVDVFMHATSFSFNEVKQVLLSGILNQLGSN